MRTCQHFESTSCVKFQPEIRLYVSQSRTVPMSLGLWHMPTDPCTALECLCVFVFLLALPLSRVAGEFPGFLRIISDSRNVEVWFKTNIYLNSIPSIQLFYGAALNSIMWIRKEQGNHFGEFKKQILTPHRLLVFKKCCWVGLFSNSEIVRQWWSNYYKHQAHVNA